MSNNIKPMPIAVNDFNLKNLQEKANAKKYDNYIYDIGIFFKNNPSIANKKSNTKYWFDELKPLAPAETYISVIGKIKSNNLYKQQIEDVNKLFRDNWDNLIYLITSKDEYIKLKNDLAEYVIDDCKSKIKELCKIDKTFKIEDKEYKITQSGIIAGMFLIKKKDDSLIIRIKDYLLKGVAFPEKGLFEKYMARFENYYLDLLFYETFKITVPAIDENYKSDFENNPNRVAKKISLGNEKGKIVLKKFRPNFYKINIPEFLQSNGMPLGSEDTIKKDITIEDVSSDGLIVVNGATLKCEGGLSTSKLTIPKSKLKLNDNYVGTVEDHIVNKNITSFKTCTYSGNANTHNNSKTAPCKIPSISEWDKGLSYFLMDKPVITDKSTCKCSYGATISIVDTGQKFWNYNGEGTAGGETQNQGNKNENSGAETKPVGFSGGIDNSVYGNGNISKDKLCYPVDLKFNFGEFITSYLIKGKSYNSMAPFGTSRSKGKRTHAAHDFYCPLGTPIYAIADGVIKQYESFYLKTWVISIEHDFSIISSEYNKVIVRYGEVMQFENNSVFVGYKNYGKLTGEALKRHQSLKCISNIKVGAKVKKGDLIGYAGILSDYISEANNEYNSWKKNPNYNFKNLGSMLHLEFFKGTSTGKFGGSDVNPSKFKYVPNGKFGNYGRRDDLLDPNNFISLDILKKYFYIQQKGEI